MRFKKLILIFAIILVSAMGMGGCEMSGGFFSSTSKQSEENLSVKEEKVISDKGINNILVKDLHTNIELIPWDEMNINVKLYTNVNSKKSDNYKLNIEEIEGKIIIEVLPNKKLSFNWKGNEKLKIFIPKEYSDNIRVETSEGTTNIGKFKLDSLEVQATSGHIITEDLDTKNAIAKNSSGKIRMDRFSGNLVAESSSGSIIVQMDSLNENNIGLKSNSGSIELTIPKNSDFNLKSKSLSGKVGCNHSINIEKEGRNIIEGYVGNSKNNININSGSGSINVN